MSGVKHGQGIEFKNGNRYPSVYVMGKTKQMKEKEEALMMALNQ